MKKLLRVFLATIALTFFVQATAVWAQNGAAKASGIGWCSIQWPHSGEVDEGGEYNVYAQIWIDNVTQNPGETPNLLCWIGVSSENTHPSNWTHWVPASFNKDDGNNDEYMANIATGLTPGTYYYASRFQHNDGDYAYGGVGNFWNETTNTSGVLTVTRVITNKTCETAMVITAGTHHSYNSSDTDFDQWFSYTSTINGTITIDNCASDVDGELMVKETSCDGTVILDVNDDNCGASQVSETHTIPVTAGTTYLIGWKNGDYGSLADDFEWNLVENPAAVTITSPVNNAVFDVTEVSVEFAVENFVLGTHGKLAYKLGDGAVAYKTDNTPIVFDELENGDYTVYVELVTMSNVSLSPEVTAEVSFTVAGLPSAVKPVWKEKVNVYPNPFSYMLRIENVDNAMRVVVSNLLGQTVLNVKLGGASQAEINTEALQSGVYLVTVISGNGERSVRRVVKR